MGHDSWAGFRSCHRYEGGRFFVRPKSLILGFRMVWACCRSRLKSTSKKNYPVTSQPTPIRPERAGRDSCVACKGSVGPSFRMRLLTLLASMDVGRFAWRCTCKFPAEPNTGNTHTHTHTHILMTHGDGACILEMSSSLVAASVKKQPRDGGAGHYPCKRVQSRVIWEAGSS